MPVQCWKRLLSDFYRGNPLIPEYLGGDSQVLKTENYSIASVDSESAPMQNSAGEELCAFISFDHEVVDQALVIHTQCCRLGKCLKIHTMETGGGAIDAFLRCKVDLGNVVSVRVMDGILNLTRISFGATETLLADMQTIVKGLAKELAKDAVNLALQKISVALSWPVDRMNVTLSLRGSPGDIELILPHLLTVIDPLKPPSAWIESLSDVIRQLAPRQTPTSNLWNVLDGALGYNRSADVEWMFLPTPQLVEQLQAEGLLLDQADDADIESQG